MTGAPRAATLALVAAALACAGPPPEPDESMPSTTAAVEPTAAAEAAAVDRARGLFPAPPSPGADPSRFAHLPRFGFGRPATEEEIAAWDIDVRPDGTGLPPGRGTVAEGERLYARLCVQCHGERGRGGPNDALVGPAAPDFPFARDPSLVPTIGSYWPYATTLFDYIRRAMPQAVPGSLPPDQVYSLVAYLLYLNGIVPADATLDETSLPRIVMPARDRFVLDDRRGGAELR